GRRTFDSGEPESPVNLHGRFPARSGASPGCPFDVGGKVNHPPKGHKPNRRFVFATCGQGLPERRNLAARNVFVVGAPAPYRRLRRRYLPPVASAPGGQSAAPGGAAEQGSTCPLPPPPAAVPSPCR